MSKILIADDSVTMRSVMKVHLMGCGYEFVEAEDGARAHLLAKLGRFDLALIDYQMPILSGFDLLEKIRSDSTDLRHLPIVLLTANHCADLRARALSLGANAFVRKPVSGPELVSVVSRLLVERNVWRTAPTVVGASAQGRARP